MFYIHTNTIFDGLKKEFKYSPERTFERAIQLSRDPNVLTTWITESRWCVEQNRMIEKMYHVFNDSIFEISDPLNPVFSVNPSFSLYMKIRYDFQKKCEEVAKLFDDLQITRAISIEYFYGFTVREINELKNKLIKELPFYNAIADNAEGIKALSETLKLFKVPMPNLRELLKTSPEILTPLVTRALTTEFKVWLVPNVYGGDFNSFTKLRI